MQRGDRLGLDRVEHRGAPRDGAGVPVLELAPGDEDEGIVLVRAFRRGNDVGRHELAAPGGRGKLVGEDHRLARIAFVLAGVGHAAFLFQPLPGDAGDGRHRLAHLVEHVRSTTVVPVEAHAARDFLDDPQIGLRLARRLQRLAAELHHAVGVGDGAILLRPRSGGQDDVCEIAGFGEEDLLHHQPVELRERLARVMRVGVRHRRVLAHDVHAADLAVEHRVHDLDDREPRLGIERRAPQFLEARACLVVVHALIVREHHRNQAGIGSALNVVLAAQGVQPGAGAPDLTGHQAQRDEAARIVGAVYVLRDAHAPQDHRGFRPGVEPRHFPDGPGGNATDRRHRLRAVARDVLLELLVAAGAAPDELLVHQPFVHDRVHHGIEQRDIGVGLELQEVCRVA